MSVTETVTFVYAYVVFILFILLLENCVFICFFCFVNNFKIVFYFPNLMFIYLLASFLILYYTLRIVE